MQYYIIYLTRELAITGSKKVGEDWEAVLVAIGAVDLDKEGQVVVIQKPVGLQANLWTLCAVRVTKDTPLCASPDDVRWKTAPDVLENLFAPTSPLLDGKLKSKLRVGLLVTIEQILSEH